MPFESLLFLIIVVCVAWSLVVSCAVFIEGLSDAKWRSELPMDSSLTPGSLPKVFNAFTGVIHALNYFLPIGIVCLAFPVHIHRTNPGGFGSLMLVTGMLAVAMLATWEAGRLLEHDGQPGLLSLHLWWAF